MPLLLETGILLSVRRRTQTPPREIDGAILLYYDAPDLTGRSADMRGDDERSSHLFSYLSPEQRVPTDHPLRAIRTMTDDALRRMSPRFEALYASTGRPSVPPEQLLRALLLHVL